MTELDNLALFAVGLAITLPAGGVVIALVYAAGIDERAEKKRQGAPIVGNDAGGVAGR